MANQIIFFPWIFPGMNEIVAEAKRRGRGGPILYATFKREWTNQSHLMIKAAKIMPVKRAFFIFDWKEKNRRRDPDNIAAGGRKFIFDGLVNAGVIHDDGWKHVAGWEDHFTIVDPGTAGVQVQIQDDDGGVTCSRRNVRRPGAAP